MANPKQTYIYKCLLVSTLNASQTELLLNKLGLEGWQLVMSTPTSSPTSTFLTFMKLT